MKLFVSFMIVAALPAEVLFSDDFETGDFAAWDGVSNHSIDGTSAWSVVQGRAHSGLYSFKSSAPSSGSRILLGVYPIVTPLRCAHIQVGPVDNTSPGHSTCDTPAAYSEMYMRFFMKIEPGLIIPSGARIVNCAGEILQLKASGGQIYLYDYRAGKTGTHAISDTDWHAIEIHSKACTTNPCTTNDGITEVLLDGVLDISNTTATTLAPLNTATIYFGLDNVTAAAGTVYFDDVVISTEPIGIPATIMTVRRPNTANRTGIPVDVILFGQSLTDVLSASVDGIVVYQKSGSVQARERFTITGMGTWSAGDHPFTVQLASSSGTVKATYTDTLRKYKDGTPTVSIDENNNISRNGHKFFPIGLYGSLWHLWTAQKAVNTYCCSEYYQANYGYSPTTTADFLQAILNPAPAILPGENWTGRGDNGRVIYPASVSTSVQTATGYVTALANQPNLLMWTWGDEMDLGPGDGHVPVSRALELTNATHVNDPDHPVFSNLTGYEVPQTSFYHGRYAPRVADGRGWTADVYSTDTYPITYLADPKQWTIKKWVRFIDRLVQQYTFGLVPIFQFVEGGINNRVGTAGCCNGPNGTQILMESWLGVIHGLKGINWWSTFVNVGSDPLGTSNNDQYSGMAQFVRQMARFQGTILGSTPRGVTSNTGWSPSLDNSVDGSRVDVAAWNSDTGNILIVAARLSEATEPTPIPASAWTQTTCNGSANCFYTTYKYPLAGVGNATTGRALTFQPTGPSSLATQQYAYDTGTNTLTVRNDAGAPMNNQFIAFSAGLVHAPGTQTISAQLTVAGVGNAIATVVDENRTVPVVGGIIVDQFAPAAVHIYQIGQTSEQKSLAPPTGLKATPVN